jgi:L,D-transpeptidase ErfK/SrfK
VKFFENSYQHRASRLVLGAVWALSSLNTYAASFAVANDVVGEIVLTSTIRTDTIADIARTYSQGYREMRMANPSVDPWLTGEDTEVVIPSQYVLPDAPQDGVVINVPEMRLYYYPRAKKGEQRLVATYPISIGRQDWSTPHGATRIVSKVKDPTWTPPESIRREHAAEGDILPAVVPAGPQNPLGAYALRLGISGYLIHGTDKPYGIGMRVTHGCMRLYPEDIARVFHTVPVGTTVRLVNEPFKIGIANGRIYLEVHPHLEEDDAKFKDPFTYVASLIAKKSAAYEVRLDWQATRAAVYQADGIPRDLGSAVLRQATARRTVADNR